MNERKYIELDMNYKPTEEEKRASKKLWDNLYYNWLFSIYHKRYKEMKNPVYAWGVYHLCRQKNISVPEWVLQYFDEVAGNLRQHPRQGERTGVFLQKSLRMDVKGRGDIFQRYIDTEKKIEPVWEINKLLRQGMSLEDAIAMISRKTGINEDTLHKWYYKYKTAL